MPDTLAEALRRRDPDRWFTALFAPPAARDTLFTLYAFNHELARASEVAHATGLALIRLQWWREVVEGAVRAHEVATPLRAALAAGALLAEDCLAMLDAREREAEAEMPTLDAWRDWLLQGPGSLAVAAGRVLGAPAGELARLRALGAGYGVAGQLGNIAAFARQGRCLLPADLLAEHGLSTETVAAGPDAPSLRAVRAVLAGSGAALLGRAQPAARSWIAAALPAVLARRDLAGPRPLVRPRPFADRLAVVAAALSGRA